MYRNSQNDRIAIHLFYISRENKKEAHVERHGNKDGNRYEYRKPQEKRKQMIAPDLFEFAYVPDWYGHLAELEKLALPESWKFRKPSRETKNTDTPILERYICLY